MEDLPVACRATPSLKSPVSSYGMTSRVARRLLGIKWQMDNHSSRNRHSVRRDLMWALYLANWLSRPSPKSQPNKASCFFWGCLAIAPLCTPNPSNPHAPPPPEKEAYNFDDSHLLNCTIDEQCEETGGDDNIGRPFNTKPNRITLEIKSVHPCFYRKLEVFQNWIDTATTMK